MVDIVGKETRSRMMSNIRGENTKPEMIVRRGLHRLGFRYRLHARELPGKPDLYFPSYQAAIFVNGCFWHRHHCSYFKWPSTRPEFWQQKLEGNAIRDAKKQIDLCSFGIRSLVIWECAIRDKSSADIDEVIKLAATWVQGNRESFQIPDTEFEIR